MGKPTMWFLNGSDTNWAVQLEAGNFGFREEFFYLCSENKGTDQLRSCCEADLTAKLI